MEGDSILESALVPTVHGSPQMLAGRGLRQRGGGFRQVSLGDGGACFGLPDAGEGCPGLGSQIRNAPKYLDSILGSFQKSGALIQTPNNKTLTTRAPTKRTPKT